MAFTNRVFGLSATIGLLVLAGCATPPPEGRARGRVSPGETTDAELGTGQMVIADLDDASERMAEALMADLSDMQENEFKAADGQNYESTLVFGDIANKTGNMPTTDFEVVRERMRSKLFGSREFKRHFRIIESRARWESVRDRELSDTDVTKSSDQHRKINAEHTFFLNGNAFRVSRGGTTNKFYMNFQLMRASDSEIVFNKDYEQTYK